MHFVLISFTSHHIYGDVTKGGFRWKFVGVYGCANSCSKYRTWELINQFFEEAIILVLLGEILMKFLAHVENKGGFDR